MKIEKYTPLCSRFLIVVFILNIFILGVPEPLFSQEKWGEKLKQGTKNIINKAKTNIKPTIEKLSQKSNKIIKDSQQKIQNNWEANWKPKVNEASRRGFEYIRTETPEMQRKLRRLYEDISPRVVETISHVKQEYGPKVASRVADYYNLYGEKAGDRLRDKIRSVTPKIRDQMVDIYTRYGDQVGDAIQGTIRRHGDDVVYSLKRAYEQYGPQIGNNIRTVYEKWNLNVAYNIQKTYETYGPSIGERIRIAYDNYGSECGDNIRNQYLPAITRTVKDPAFQEKAVLTCVNFYKFSRNIKPIARQTVYNSLSTLSDIPIPAKNGKTTVREECKKYIRKNMPWAIGTDLEDPAKVGTVATEVAVVFIFTGQVDMSPVYNDLKILPGKDGQPVSMNEKLYELSPMEEEQLVATLDLMADIETVADSDLETEDITASVNLINTSLSYYNTRYKSTSF